MIVRYQYRIGFETFGVYECEDADFKKFFKQREQLGVDNIIVEMRDGRKYIWGKGYDRIGKRKGLVRNGWYDITRFSYPIFF